MNALFLGQILIGIGCAPALMAAIVFTLQHWPVARFAAISGLSWLSAAVDVVVGDALGMGDPSLVMAKRVCRPDDSVDIHAARLRIDPGKIRSAARAAARARNPGRIYGLRFVLFGHRAVALLAIGFVSYGAVVTIRGLGRADVRRTVRIKPAFGR